MTIQQLEYILEVNRAGSMSKAAKNLFVSHSSVSNSVAALEEELGFPVFERSYQGVIPSKQGREVLEHAAQVCEHLRRMHSGKTPPSRRIRIETTHSHCCSNALLRLLEECRGQDDLRFYHETYHTSKTAMSKLATFDLDLVVHSCMSNFLHEFKKEVAQHGLEWKHLGVLPGVIKIGPKHRLYNKPDLTPRDFKDEIIIDAPQANVANSSAMKALIGFDPDRALLVTTRENRYELVSKGFGFAIGRKSPEYIDRQYGLRNVLLPEIQHHQFYIFNPARPLGPELQRYIALLEEELAPLRID